MASAKPDFALPPQTVLHAHYLLGDTLGGGAPQKYEGILREIDRISRLSSIAQQAESLQQLLQGSGVIFRLLTNGFRKA